MKLSLVPRTCTGRWSVRLLVLFILFYAALILLVASGEKGGATFFSNWKLAVSGLLAGLSGIGAFFVSLVSVLLKKERAVLVFVSLAIGLLVFLFILGEIIFPH